MHQTIYVHTEADDRVEILATDDDKALWFGDLIINFDSADTARRVAEVTASIADLLEAADAK